MYSVNRVNKFIKARNDIKILSLQVGSLTCWLRNNKPERSVNGLAIGQVMVGHDQSMLGKLISPSIMVLGNDIM